MPEDDSGHDNSNVEMSTPFGWSRRHADEPIIRPDWGSEEYPGRVDGREPRLRDQIKDDPGLIAAFERYQDRVVALAWSDDEAAIAELVAIAEELAEHHRPLHVPARMVAIYLLERWLFRVPAEKLRKILGRIEPVHLFANAGKDSHDFSLHPGEFAMVFAGASGRDRKAFDGLIRKAQAEWGYAFDEGGRPKTEEDAATAEQAKTVAKLVSCGWTAPTLASFFGWTDANGSFLDDRAAEQRVARYNEKGTVIIQEEDPGWIHREITGRRPAARDGLRKRGT